MRESGERERERLKEWENLERVTSQEWDASPRGGGGRREIERETRQASTTCSTLFTAHSSWEFIYFCHNTQIQGAQANVRASRTTQASVIFVLWASNAGMLLSWRRETGVQGNSSALWNIKPLVPNSLRNKCTRYHDHHNHTLALVWTLKSVFSGVTQAFPLDLMGHEWQVHQSMADSDQPEGN